MVHYALRSALLACLIIRILALQKQYFAQRKIVYFVEVVEKNCSESRFTAAIRAWLWKL